MATGKERILESAYDLFSRDGVSSTGVDAVIEEAGVAKATLYRNFGSKSELAIAFLEERERRWTYDWLVAEAERRGSTPAERLLAIFDVFDGWFHRDDFEGCVFVTVLLDLTDQEDPVRRASVRHLQNIRAFVRGLAADAGVEDSDHFARQWHILMRGSIVAAQEDDREAAARAQELGRLLLAHHGVD
jgi:AcrR family transcriptional regulator